MNATSIRRTVVNILAGMAVAGTALIGADAALATGPSAPEMVAVPADGCSTDAECAFQDAVIDQLLWDGYTGDPADGREVIYVPAGTSTEVAGYGSVSFGS